MLVRNILRPRRARRLLAGNRLGIGLASRAPAAVCYTRSTNFRINRHVLLFAVHELCIYFAGQL